MYWITVYMDTPHQFALNYLYTILPLSEPYLNWDNVFRKNCMQNYNGTGPHTCDMDNTSSLINIFAPKP